MDNGYNNLPPDLFDKVISAIAAEKARLVAIRNFIISSCACAGTLIISVFAWNGLANELMTSGFYQYASLIFSDLKIVLWNWQDFGLSLLESFPALNAAALIAVVAALMFSLKLIFINASKIYITRHSKNMARA